MKNPVGGSPQRNPCSEQRNAPTRVPLRSGTLVRVDSATPPRGGASLQQPQTPYAIALASSSSGSWSFHVPLLIPPPCFGAISGRPYLANKSLNASAIKLCSVVSC